jgi:hypothetical protein
MTAFFLTVFLVSRLHGTASPTPIRQPWARRSFTCETHIAARLAVPVSLLLAALSAAPAAALDPPGAPSNAGGAASRTPAALPECNGWGGKPVARTELFFGLARADGSIISSDEFQHFVDREVTPRFPAGLTLLGGNGQFRDTKGITIKESAKVLILLYAYDRDNSRAIEAIRSAYAKTFQQESVLRVDGSACVTF